MQNVGVRSPRRSLVSLAAVATSAALALSGCSGSDGSDGSDSSSTPDASASSTAASGSSSAAASPSASSTVAVPDGVELTEQGEGLSFEEPATVIFEPAQGRGSTLELTVQSVAKGSLDDFKGFILDDAYKQKADYYYAKVSVKNVGEGDVGGVAVPLWGVNAANTLLPAVTFMTSFKKCPSKPLPAKFPAGAELETCLVFLSPNAGGLESVSYRPSQEFDPISWTGDITTPKPKPKPKPKAKKKG